MKRFVKLFTFVFIYSFLHGGPMTTEAKDNKLSLNELIGSNIPKNLRLYAGDFGLIKEGDNLFYRKENTFVTTMPGEPETKEPKKEKIDTKLISELWDVIKKFNFAAYKNLSEDQLIEDEQAASLCDAEMQWWLSLTVDGKELISRNFGTEKPKDKDLLENMLNFNKKLKKIVGR